MNINFILSKNEDIAILENQLNDKIIRKDNFPDLFEILIEDRINDHYENLKTDLSSSLKNIKKNWNKIQNKVEEKFKILFKTYNINNIDCIISINPFNPRFIKEKFFLLNFKAKNPNEIIVHELLHFLFFEYCFKNYFQIFKNENINNGWLWDLSEIFNYIILNDHEWKKILNTDQISYYKEHKKYFKQFQRAWANRSVDEFILNGRLILKQ